jgi:hypothetical protein
MQTRKSSEEYETNLRGGINVNRDYKKVLIAYTKDIVNIRDCSAEILELAGTFLENIYWRNNNNNNNYYYYYYYYYLYAG